MIPIFIRDCRWILIALASGIAAAAGAQSLEKRFAVKG